MIHELMLHGERYRVVLGEKPSIKVWRRGGGTWRNHFFWGAPLRLKAADRRNLIQRATDWEQSTETRAASTPRLPRMIEYAT